MNPPLPSTRPSSSQKFRWVLSLAIAAAVVVFSLLGGIAIQSIALHDQKEEIESIRREAETYRQALEIAEEKAARLQADTAKDERRPADMP